MKKFQNFAVKLPFLFGIGMFILYAILTALTYPVHYLFPDTEMGQMYGDTISKLAAFAIFLIILWRFGWIPLSGITRLGSSKTWIIVAGLLVYAVLVKLFAFTGNITMDFPDTSLAFANLVYAFSTSLVEEIMVRGLVLVAMILAWGSTKQGQVKAILLSSVLFGLFHLINLMVRPAGVVLLQALILTLPGILYAALTLAYRTLWPAILLHWLGNASINISLIGVKNYQETFSMWILFGVSLIPLVVFSVYLIWRLPQSYQKKQGDRVSQIQDKKVPLQVPQ